MGSHIQYLCGLVRGKALCQLYLFSSDVENTETPNMDYYIKDLALYLPPTNQLYKKARNAPRIEEKTRSLKVRRYAARLVDLDEHLNFFLGVTLSVKMYVTELNDIILNSMPNCWSK